MPSVKPLHKLTHDAPLIRPVHPFPARMAPAIVWEELIAVSVAGRASRLRVLDPMSGSGTTIAMARLLGHKAIGFDTDPLAVLIARAWSADLDPDLLRRSAAAVVGRARLLVRNLALKDAYPRNADDETRAFARYWYDETARRQLAALAMTIGRVRDGVLRSLLWCAFSRLIIVKSRGVSLGMDVAHSRPHKVYERAPIKPFRAYQHAANVIARHSPFADGRRRPSASVQRGDARDLPISDGSVDFVITSPPYLNAIDYLRGHRLSLIWLGHSVREIRAIRATNVGTEVSDRSIGDNGHVASAIGRMGDVESLPDREIGMLTRYVIDMDHAIAEMTRVLSPGGRAVLVIGDSTIRSVFVRNSRALAYLGKHNGLTLVNSRRRPLPANKRYLPPPCAEGAGARLENRMRAEVILTFQKRS
jgi:SAM-dependent methyltransferase